MIVVLLAFVFALILALAIVPAMAHVARRTGLVDLPDNKRKLHASAIPLVGGIAVFISVSIVAPIAIYLGTNHVEMIDWLNEMLLGWIPVDFGRRLVRVYPNDLHEMLGLFLGSLVLVGVGILDDRFGIRGRQKLLGQFLATTVLIVFGYHFDQITLLGMTIKFDVFSILFVYAWVIAAINSVNLLDGADGIAATIGIVMSLSLALMAVYQNQMVNAIIATSIAGSLLGFLRFNFPPARVYLGDTGSMLIGFVLSALAIRCTFKQNSAYAFFAPVALLAIPFIDTGAAIIRRRLTGRSIFEVDRGHLHHSLMKRGYSPRISLLWVTLLCLTTAAGGVISLLYEQSEYALLSIAIVLCVMVGCKIFGVAEYQLVTRKAGSFARSFLGSNGDNVLQSTIHVQGNRDWDACWQGLSDFADEYGLLELTLDLNAPWLHESFHAKRQRSDIARGGLNEWETQIPLIADRRVFGRIDVIGSGDETENHKEIIRQLLEKTKEIEDAMVASAPTDSVYKVLATGEDSVADDESLEPESDTDVSSATANT
jgi:UDP-GlcNAc:undecaprenyl-phosphate GlcNAc-1-phosphate transferase